MALLLTANSEISRADVQSTSADASVMKILNFLNSCRTISIAILTTDILRNL
jgi:hypothetical protein